MTRAILGYTALTFAITSVTAFAAIAGLASGYDGCAATCGDARAFLNATGFVWWLGAAFVAVLASIPLLASVSRCTR